MITNEKQDKREKDSMKWTLGQIIMWRNQLIKTKKEIKETLENDLGWDCYAMCSLRDLYLEIDTFLDDTDPESDPTYGVN